MKKDTLSLKTILRKNLPWLGILSLLTFLVYFNVLNGDFTVVDDYYGFVENQKIRDLPSSFKSLMLQFIIYSLSYSLFGVKSFPLHLLAVLFHTANVILIFLIFYLLFGRKSAFLTAFIFAVHPINTEVISWLSGNPYLHNGLFVYLTLLFYLLYKKSKKNRFLIIGAIIYILNMILVRSPWSLIAPIAILIIDQFFWEKKFLLKKNQLAVAVFFVLGVLFYFLQIHQSQVQRLQNREQAASTAQFQNQESLKPIVEGYPYTLFTMFFLYTYPKNLNIYHDGNPVNTGYKYSMYSFLLIYLILLIFFLKRDRIAAGFLLILPSLIAPAFSPIKFTWFMAERYLYAGSPFFAGLLSYLLLKMEKRINIRNLSLYIAFIIIILFSLRTIVRNFDWQNSENLALATIKSSPQNIRAYNDLGGYYVLHERYEDAVYYYKKALQIFPLSNTAINNLGFLYLNVGTKSISQKNSSKQDLELSEILLKEAKFHYEKNDTKKAVYFLVSSLELNPNLIEARNILGDIYLKENKLGFAHEHFLKSIEIDSNQEEALFKLGYLEYKLGNLDKSIEYLKKTLNLNPENTNALEKLSMIEEVGKISPSP